MGMHVADTIEEIAQLAAAEASRSRARKARITKITKLWQDVSGLLPQEQRFDAVNDAIKQIKFHNPIITRALFEAVARYALWYEGYSFGR